jgi:hypothetical protein
MAISANNVVRAVMCLAARRTNLPVRDLSFSHLERCPICLAEINLGC